MINEILETFITKKNSKPLMTKKILETVNKSKEILEPFDH